MFDSVQALLINSEMKHMLVSTFDIIKQNESLKHCTILVSSYNECF